MAKKIESGENTKKAVAKPKKSSMRESAAKSRAKSEKPKRVRKAASIAKKPVSSIGNALKKEYHVIKPKKTGFFTKSRTLTPGYFRSAWKELRQVTWPGRKETWRLVFAVFMFALVMGTVIAVLDYGLEKLLRTIIF